MDKPSARAGAVAAAAHALPDPALAGAARRPRGRPRKTLDERDDGNRRVDLLNAAARLFRQKGFDATSTRDIAAAVGMHSGSPFYHFKSKGALLYAVMDEGMRSATLRQATALKAAQASRPDAAALLGLLVRHHVNVLLGPGSDFIPVMLYETRALTARQRAALAQLRNDYEAAWEPVLRSLVRSGRIKGPHRLARLLIFGALNWSVQWFDASKSASLDDLTDAALALFLHAPAPGKTSSSRKALT